MKRITLTGKQIRELRDKALKEQRKSFAPKTRVVKSKRVYRRKDKWFNKNPYVDPWKGID